MRLTVATILIGASLTSVVFAFAPVRSLRPEARDGEAVTVGQSAGISLADASSLRGVAKPVIKPVLQKERRVTPEEILAMTSEPSFPDWVVAFRQRAGAAGITETTLDAALKDLRYLPKVVERDRNQSEFTKTLWDYLDSAASDARIANGQKALAKHLRSLEAIERRYGVDKEIVAAIWGLESAYGAFRGDTPILSALASLAYDPRRSVFFETQLIGALRIIQSGDVTVPEMTGSWAGAMGHTQFMPTSFLDYAVDFDGDGKRDIWSDDPSDALASTAAYLAGFGWTKDQPWGVEVRLPEGFEYELANRSILKSPADWGRLGVVGTDGRAVPGHGAGSILLPAGAQGAAFMIFDNFAVLERYNTADAYVIGVGHLADRIKGGGPIVAKWPRQDRALTGDERRELQERLTGAGFSTQGVDGKIGPNTIDAIRGFQRAAGLIPDGYASLALLKRLRG